MFIKKNQTDPKPKHTSRKYTEILKFPQSVQNGSVREHHIHIYLCFKLPSITMDKLAPLLVLSLISSLFDMEKIYRIEDITFTLAQKTSLMLRLRELYP